MVTTAVGLGVAGAVLLVLAVVTARRPRAPIPATVDAYFGLWSPLHGGYDPRGNAWVRGWLRLSLRGGRPLARAGVQPDVLTYAGAWVAVAVLAVAGQGGHWPALAGALVIVSGLLDTLDGCVAVLTGRATRWGYVLDSAVDRVGDVLYVAALVAAGGHVVPAGVAAAAFLELEYVRARARNAGGDEVGVVTVGERPVRVAMAAGGLLCAGVAPSWSRPLATTALAVLAVLSVVGLVQLLVVTRRRLVRGPVG